jgi:hypothetical protein
MQQDEQDEQDEQVGDVVDDLPHWQQQMH